MKTLQDAQTEGVLENEIYNADCLQVMKLMPDKSIDLVLTDPPYGITQNSWDSGFNVAYFFKEFWRVLKSNGAVVLFSQQPFTTEVISQQKENFRYELIWEKIDRPTGFLNANKMPLRSHENILIFYKKLPTYNPQWEVGDKNHTRGHSRGKKQTNNNYGKFNPDVEEIFTNKKHPRSILKFSRQHPPIHPTQKPVSLIKWLCASYSNENDIIFDPFLGSGTTCVAAKQLGRKYIGIEISPRYVEIANQRLRQEVLL